MKKGLYLFIVLFVFMYPSIVKAETNEGATCSYSDQAELNKLAYSVTANYSIVKDAAGNPNIKITVYNITSDIYVTIDSDATDAMPMVVYPSNTIGGTYSIIDTNITNIITYTIKVRSTREGCISDIRKFTILKPMKNPYHESKTCQYTGMEDYYYCREWVTSHYTISEEQIKKNIQAEYEKIKSTGATKCLTCEEEDLLSKARQEFLEKKSTILKILVVLVVINIIALIYFYQRARSYEL